MAAAFNIPLVVTLLTIGHVTLTSSSSLYQPDDPIVQLTGDNFLNTIKNSENAWFIEFYATWCAHCRRLAPLFRELAIDVKGWRHMMKVGAIACSDARNNAFCRRYNIRGYPTIRFFPPYLSNDHYGIDYTGGQTMRSLQEGIIDYLDTIQIIPPTWPKMEPVSSVQEVIHSRQRGARHMLAIAENPRDGMDRYTAKKLLFDLSGLPDVHVMRMRTQSHPSGVYNIYKSGVMVAIAEGTNRKDLRNKVLQYLHRASTTPAITTTTIPMTPVPTGTRGLHMQDLESGLYNTLWFEIGGKRAISGAALKALKKFIYTLKEYFPGPLYNVNFLTQLDTWLQDQHGRVRGEDWVEKLESLQSEESYVAPRLRWTGCAGSRSSFRGYTCSLWQTFHALTVNALEKNIRNRNYDPRDVLLNIREYVRHFMGCRECAKHFVAMSRDVESVVRHPRDGVLWLWRAHNRVNKRLSGDSTEDPLHPKREFPTVAQCPTCRIAHTESSRHHKSNTTEWNDEEVMIYLRQFYGEDFVIPDSLPYRPIVVAPGPLTSAPKFIPPEREPLEKGEPHVSDTLEPEVEPAPEELPTYPRIEPTPAPITTRWTRPDNWWTPRPTPRPQTWRPRTRPPQPIRPGPAFTPAPTPTPRWTPIRQSTPAPRWVWPTETPITLRPTPGQTAPGSCPEMSTRWSTCSCSCGTGVSTRMSNQNPECKTKLETRICQIRPCNYRFVQGRRRTCGSTYRSAQYLSMSYGDCETTSMMQWRYCGECYGKCCYPKRSRTQEFGFVCGKNPETRVFGYANVHIIELCECSNQCP